MKTPSRDGTVLAYQKEGSGPAVVLIDGALCTRAIGPMGNLVPLLAPKFTVFYYDRRGRGESGASVDYSVDREIEDLQAIIAATGGSAMVFGMSSGAALAIRAATEGLNITKLALYEPPFQTLSEGGAEHLKKVRVLEDLLNQERHSEALTYFQTVMVGIPKFISMILRLTPLWPKLK